jgi:hypothetical protein
MPQRRMAYNLLVHKNHNYFVGESGILVHNGVGELCERGTAIFRKIWFTRAAEEKTIDTLRRVFDEFKNAAGQLKRPLSDTAIAGMIEEASEYLKGVVAPTREKKTTFDGEDIDGPEVSDWLIKKFKACWDESLTPLQRQQAQAEFRAAIAERRAGNSVHFREERGNGKRTSDFFVNGRAFENAHDVYSPASTTGEVGIIKALREKVSKPGESDPLPQTNVVILDVTHLPENHPMKNLSPDYWRAIIKQINTRQVDPFPEFPPGFRLEEVRILQDDAILTSVKRAE